MSEEKSTDSKPDPKPKQPQKRKGGGQRQKQRGRKKPRHKSAGPRTPVQLLAANFVACGRCSFFLTGYRAAAGLATLTEQANAQKNGWLDLSWTHQIRNLVEGSYGCEIFSTTGKFEGTCIECQRVFVIDGLPTAENKADSVITFQVQSSPKSRNNSFSKQPHHRK